MKRRVIKQGHNTLTVTLPAKWVKKLNLSAGNEIDMFEKGNVLSISINTQNEYKKISIDLDELSIPLIWKYFMSLYREGYDEILVKFSDKLILESPYKFLAHHKLDLKYKKERERKTPLEFLHELMTRFIGFEITSYNENSAVIKDMGVLTSKEFDNSLRRVFLLVQQMCEETCKALNTNNPRILSHIHDVDINLDKFHDYCIRILNKTKNKEQEKSSLLFTTLYLLELMGDEFKNISQHLLYDFSETNFKNMREIADSIKNQLNEFYNLFYKFDKEKIKKISEIDSKRYFDVRKVYKKTKSEDEKEIYHHLRIISKYINALLEIRIEMEF